MRRDHARTWTCGRCDAANVQKLTKYEAAFDRKPVRDEHCAQCRAVGHVKYCALAMPTIDAEILEWWCADSTLALLDQDEDLLLATAPIDLLLEFYEDDAKVRDRKADLLAALALAFPMSEGAERTRLRSVLLRDRALWDREGFLTFAERKALASAIAR
ncbi:MAG TPA: hypothetical protein VG841_09115 [Caulobacterales bacterium]|nr:hypothetical protein [Caulobacterales bacterium]